jgi:hypothetical protein
MHVVGVKVRPQESLSLIGDCTSHEGIQKCRFLTFMAWVRGLVRPDTTVCSIYVVILHGPRVVYLHGNAHCYYSCLLNSPSPCPGSPLYVTIVGVPGTSHDQIYSHLQQIARQHHVDSVVFTLTEKVRRVDRVRGAHEVSFSKINLTLACCNWLPVVGQSLLQQPYADKTTQFVCTFIPLAQGASQPMIYTVQKSYVEAITRGKSATECARVRNRLAGCLHFINTYDVVSLGDCTQLTAYCMASLVWDQLCARKPALTSTPTNE